MDKKVDKQNKTDPIINEPTDVESQYKEDIDSYKFINILSEACAMAMNGDFDLSFCEPEINIKDNTRKVPKNLFHTEKMNKLNKIEDTVYESNNIEDMYPVKTYTQRRPSIMIEDNKYELNNLEDKYPIKAYTQRHSNLNFEIKRFFNDLKSTDKEFRKKFSSGKTKLERFVNSLDIFTRRKRRTNSIKLTKEEKKVNHLESEQTRRNTINIGLEAIRELIPNDDKKSKKSVIIEAIWYILKLKLTVNKQRPM